MAESNEVKEAVASVTNKSTGSGLEPNIAGLLAWIFAPIGSIIFLVIDKDNKFVKFHAWQSLIWSIASWVIVSVLYFVITLVTFGFGALCAWLLYFVPIVVQIIGAVKAYNNEMWKLPVIGDWSEEQASK